MIRDKNPQTDPLERAASDGRDHPLQILIVGLGLIGGSYAKAFKKYTVHRVYALESNPDVLEAARKDGAVDGAGDPDQLECYDLILLALYPAQTIAFIERYAHRFGKGQLVLDSCGVKQAVCAKLAPLAQEHGFLFVGAHPMAGKERGGFENSSADLFNGASFIVTPSEETAWDCAPLWSLMQEIGFNRLVRATPARHDEMIAYTSQLPHLLACCYVLDEKAPFHTGYSAGSFRDVSRVALINEQLWTQLFLENRVPLIQQLGLLIDNLRYAEACLQSNDETALAAFLKRGREMKEATEA